jgi:hypothetical protein
VLIIALVAGCSATAQSPETPSRNGTLSLPNYEHAGSASSEENRVFWDRSKSWEDPGNRSAMIASHTHTYRNLNDTDTVAIYTIPRKKYVGSDSVRSLSAPELGDLITGSVDVGLPGSESGPTYRASLLDRDVTVWTVTDAGGNATGHVTRVTRDNVIVAVAVAGGANRTTVERVLGNVSLHGA